MRMALRAAPEAETPTTRLAVEINPSLAPSTAARSQPMCAVRCRSTCIGYLRWLEVVNHHVREEEGEGFSSIRSECDGDELDRMADQFEREKEKLLA